MENENIVPGTNETTTPQTPASSSTTPSFQGNILLIVAAALILIGFFLPWINTGLGGRGGFSDYGDYESAIPAINGTYLISLAGEVPEIGWLLTIYLLLLPVGAIIVLYCANQKAFSEKAMMFGIAASAFLPITLFTLYIFIPKYAILFDEDEFGRNSLKLGIGFIMMLLGSVYCFIYAIRRIAQNMNNIPGAPMFKFGSIAGLVIGGLTYLILDNMKDPEISGVYIYLGLFILGILAATYLYRNNTPGNSNYHSSNVTGFIYSGVYVFTLLIIASITTDGGTGRMGEVILFLLVGQCLFGFIFSSLAGSTGVTPTPIVHTGGNIETSVTATEQPGVPVQSKIVSPPFDWGAYYKKNKKTILTVSILLVCGIAAWILLKPNPERDGRKAAKAECNCKTDSDKAITKVYEDFVAGFDSAHFKSRSEARSKLQGMITSLEAEGAQCDIAAKEKFETIAKKFRKDYKKMAKFYASYYKAKNSCTSNADLTGLNSKVDEKLKTIKEPEPDIDKIKVDLINQSIPGWTFHYLTEIKQASVVNTTRTDDRIEYTVDLKLENYANTTEQCDAQVIIAYNQGDEGWYMSSMNEVFIAFANIAPVGDWKIVSPVSGCSYTIVDGGKRYWIQDGSYGTKYKGGGDDGETFSLTSTQLYIMSREEQPVTIIFRYVPQQQ